jgi:DeoR/GlpR family transcriptional regulator of sugar metabolism
MMLARQRHAYILDRVRTEGGVRVADLVRALSVSDMTVRRDLEALDEQGFLKKVHGGATAIDGAASVELGFTTKSTLEIESKRAIADAAARLVHPGQAIAISAGTTTYEVARRLLDVPRLTVVTNSVPVADTFHHGGRSDQTVIITGGVRTPSDALVGPVAVAALRSLHVDLVLIGIHGMDSRAGFTTPNMLEAETDIALIETGRRLVVVADHTKWGVIGVTSIGQLSRADMLITDDGLDPGARAELEERVGELVVVPARPLGRRGVPAMTQAVSGLGTQPVERRHGE